MDMRDLKLDRRQERDDFDSVPLLVKIAITLAILVVTLQIVIVVVFDDKLSAIGVSGDMAGSLNALCSGMAFIVLILTLRMQQQEMRLQRIELAMTREQLELQRKEHELSRGVMEEQKNELASQRESMQRQLFEHAYFSLVKLLLESRSQVVNSEPLYPISGTLAINAIFKNLIHRVYNEQDFVARTNPRPGVEYMESAIDSFFKNEKYFFGAYFSSLHAVRHFVTSSDFRLDRKYREIVTTLLTPEEASMLAFRSLSDSEVRKSVLFFGIDELQIEGRTIFENLRVSIMANRS